MGPFHRKEQTSFTAPEPPNLSRNLRSGIDINMDKLTRTLSIVVVVWLLTTVYVSCTCTPVECSGDGTYHIMRNCIDQVVPLPLIATVTHPFVLLIEGRDTVSHS